MYKCAVCTFVSILAQKCTLCTFREKKKTRVAGTTYLVDLLFSEGTDKSDPARQTALLNHIQNNYEAEPASRSSYEVISLTFKTETVSALSGSVCF